MPAETGAPPYARFYAAAPELNIPSLPEGLVAEGLSRLAKQHHLCGALVGEHEPTLFIRMPRSNRESPRPPMAMPWGWDSEFGGVLSLTFASPTNSGRVLLSREEVTKAGLSRGRFSVVFCHSGRPYAGKRLDFGSDLEMQKDLDKHVQRVLRHSCDLPDERAAKWDVIRCLRQTLEKDLTAEDRLSLGWVDRYRRQVAALKGVVEEMATAPAFPGAPQGGPVGDLFRRERLATIAGLAHAFDALSQECPTYFAFLDSLRGIHEVCESLGTHCYCGATIHFPQALLLGSESTMEGRRVPWMKRDGTLAHLQLAPQGFPEGSRPEDYWPRMFSIPTFNLGTLVGASDFPADLTTPERWALMPRAEDPVATSATACSLLAEATANKKWTIPDKALVELPVGPFTHIELFETGNPTEVAGLFRNTANEFAIAEVEPEKPFFNIDDIGFIDPEAREPYLAALQLLLAATVRDFFVVEERESVFATRRRRVGTGSSTNASEVRVVYLPRVRYVASPSLERCASELEHAERRAHFVTAHLRRVESPSPHQIALASRYGLAVPKGYTFVRPHERGKVPKSVVYRSRSALRTLYEVKDDVRDERVDGWFQFERDVNAAMASLGFTVEHVARGRRGDGGVDVFARKGSDLDEVCWVIQCKCYSHGRVVGPNVVRELVGTLQEYPNGTRGMVVTTSTFSGEAKRIADQNNIRLMAGDEFHRVLDKSPRVPAPGPPVPPSQKWR